MHKGSSISAVAERALTKGLVSVKYTCNCVGLLEGIINGPSASLRRVISLTGLKLFWSKDSFVKSKILLGDFRYPHFINNHLYQITFILNYFSSEREEGELGLTQESVLRNQAWAGSLAQTEEA